MLGAAFGSCYLNRKSPIENPQLRWRREGDSNPYELSNLGSDSRLKQVRKDLDERLLPWLEEVKDPILQGPTPTAYYKMAIADLTTGNT